ncbi:hypothetical protein [Portibacter marinus]|uniref:hypothetical protein n=1 Tax=Portibacter marinus TaxID=2898660 RepID=UPI001F450C55|nr:hypothetical protein [Portibacter marinus]
MESEEKKVLAYILIAVMFFATFSPVTIELYHLTSHADDIILGEYHFHNHDSNEVGHSHKILKQSDNDKESKNKHVNTDLTIKNNKIFKSDCNVDIIQRVFTEHCFFYQKIFSIFHREVLLPPPNPALV